MNWLLLLLLTLVVQMLLILLRPRGWLALLSGLVSVQWITACLLSAVVVPMIFSAMLTTWGEWQRSRSSSSIGETMGTSDQSKLTNVLPFRDGEGGRLSTPYLHGPIADWQGVDYARPCGSELVAPADMIVEGVGVDDGAGNTSIRLRFVADPGLELGLVHGDYIVGVGDYLGVGHIIGYTASRGRSSGCHDHVVLWRDGVVLDVSKFRATDSGKSLVSNKPLLMSRYDPDLGGINCDSDCSVTSTGALVDDWWGAGAACIKEWTARDVVVEIEGRRWRCIDTGGKVVEEEHGIWVDLLTKHSAYAYGELVYDWRIVNE